MMRARGFTLLEMILVLAIIASLVALSVPAMRASLSTSKLRDAAKRVRAGLAKARLRAIESGTAQQFRFQPGRRAFEVTPRPVLNAGGGLRFISAQVLPAGGPADGSSTAARPSQEEGPQFELPDGIRFGNLESNHRAAGEPPSFDSGSTARLGAHRWSTPIVFYPNGRTSNARIRLIGRGDFYLDVTLRGVTGAAKIGELARREQTQ